MKIQQALELLIDRKDLQAADMESVMRQVMTRGNPCADWWLSGCLADERRVG